MDLREEKELIARAGKDPQVLGQVYEEYYPRIFRYVLRRVGNVAVAEDITSEAFFKCLKSLWRFKWQGVSFSAWLYKVASNEVNCYFRQGKHKGCSLDLLLDNGFEPLAKADIQAEIEDAETRLQRHKQFLAIQKQLTRLPLQYQEVIALRFFESKKIDEIAEILGKKDGTIKSLLHRGVEMLRKNWTGAEPTPQMQPISQLDIVTNRDSE